VITHWRPATAKIDMAQTPPDLKFKEVTVAGGTRWQFLFADPNTWTPMNFSAGDRFDPGCSTFILTHDDGEILERRCSLPEGSE
jgi:hypothetical protein